jgi:hypothetical protein
VSHYVSLEMSARANEIPSICDYSNLDKPLIRISNANRQLPKWNIITTAYRR